MNMPTVSQVPQWMVCFDNGDLIEPFGCVNRRIFFMKSLNYDQIWDIKEKGFCIFAHFELLTKSFCTPGGTLR